MRLQNAVKEWAGVVNAIGTGEQLIIVRRYEPRSRDLFLYPTFNYYNSEKANREGFDAKFQAPFRDSAWSAGKHAMERGQAECLVDVSYWVHVDQVINIEDHSVWKKLSKFYIWSPEHVESYAKGSRTGNVLLWILREPTTRRVVCIFRLPNHAQVFMTNTESPQHRIHRSFRLLRKNLYRVNRTSGTKTNRQTSAPRYCVSSMHT